MVEQMDVWRTANVLIRAHGDEAALIAAQQADALLAQGDVEGQRVFKAIVEAIAELQRASLREREKLN